MESNSCLDVYCQDYVNLYLPPSAFQPICVELQEAELFAVLGRLASSSTAMFSKLIVFQRRSHRNDLNVPASSQAGQLLFKKFLSFCINSFGHTIGICNGITVEVNAVVPYTQPPCLEISSFTSNVLLCSSLETS